MNSHDSPANRVTLVDDEPWALDVLVRAARHWQFDCQSATSAEEALRLLEKDLTPIVVTDIRMPGRDGVWLVSEIHRRWPEVGIIVITAGHDEESVVRCLNAGAHHFFFKPINLDEFHHALESTSRNFQLQRQNNQYRDLLEETIHRKTKKIRHTFLSAIDSLVRLLEARDPYTSGHSLRVSHYTVSLARELGLPRKGRKQIRLAAKLHDIGKVGVPEAILNKTGSLTDDERMFVQKHPVIGERILTPIIRNRTVLGAIRHHHERYDGNGYPDGLSREQIPLLARLIAVADCFDALTSSRAYRKALSVTESLDILQGGSGTQFDPNLVPPFVKLVLSGRFSTFFSRG